VFTSGGWDLTKVTRLEVLELVLYFG